MSKKPYVKPTVTDLGNAVEETKGISGVMWELRGTQWSPVIGGDDD